jgi:hypothetical protein
VLDKGIDNLAILWAKLVNLPFEDKEDFDSVCILGADSIKWLYDTWGQLHGD